MIDPKLFDKVAWLNIEYLKPPVSGLILRFPGLGATVSMKTAPDTHDLEWGQAGGLSVAPYQDPWGWMNHRVVDFTDDLVEGLRERYKILSEIPLIATGGSMGGHAALLYSIKSRHRISACMALWPVCDLVAQYSERADIPRTLHHAFQSYENIDRALQEHSPLHEVTKLPRIPYLIMHGEKDEEVRKKTHSDVMAIEMRKWNFDLEYVERANTGHGYPLDFEAYRRTVDFPKSHLRPVS